MGLCRVLVYVAGLHHALPDALDRRGADALLLISLTCRQQENLGKVENLWPLAFSRRRSPGAPGSPRWPWWARSGCTVHRLDAGGALVPAPPRGAISAPW
jgi:hypothetical protein